MSVLNPSAGLVCPNCSAELEAPSNPHPQYHKSAPIPNRSGFCYGLCNCGYVMVMEFDRIAGTDVEFLVAVQPTGSEPGPETDRQILEAAACFKQAKMPYETFRYTQKADAKQISQLRNLKYEDEKPSRDSVDAYSAHYEESHQDDSKEAPVGFWRRLMAKLKGWFK